MILYDVSGSVDGLLGRLIGRCKSQVAKVLSIKSNKKKGRERNKEIEKRRAPRIAFP
jgi:hypothetical protein